MAGRSKYLMLIGLAATCAMVASVWVVFRQSPERADSPNTAAAKPAPGSLAEAAAGAGRAADDAHAQETAGTPTRFDEAARESGIDFRMRFLPGEQGENFKINLYDHGCGVAVADYDGDGLDDIYLLNQLGPNALFRNQGDGSFEDVTEQAGVAMGDRICVAATFADYDNDGDQDLFVTSTRGGNVLFQNDDYGHFRDVTEETGVGCIAHSQTASFFDADNDGYLDLLVTNTARWTTNTLERAGNYFLGPEQLWKLARSPKEFNILFHNERDGTFTDVTEQSGLKGVGWGGDIAVADADEDGWLDVLITNMFGSSQLYHNEGSARFTDITEQSLGRTSWGAIGSKFFDFNNDGRLDLLIVDMHSDMWMPFDFAPTGVVENVKYHHITGPFASTSQRNSDTEAEFAVEFQVQYQEVLFGNTFFLNHGDNRFEEVSTQANLETFWPWGITTGDFDNDGYEDVYLPSGMGYPFFYWRSPLMMNNGDETFTDQSRQAGMEPPKRGTKLPELIGNQEASRSSRCAATGDFDADGRLELIVNNFNDYPYFFKNHSAPRNYVAFQLRGTRGNRDAIGARVKLYVGQEIMVRQMHCAGGYLSQSSSKLHFGLGDRERIDRIEIFWPSGMEQSIVAPDINRLHEITEPTG